VRRGAGERRRCIHVTLLAGDRGVLAVLAQRREAVTKAALISMSWYENFEKSLDSQ
jgi:hypothetical protein